MKCGGRRNDGKSRIRIPHCELNEFNLTNLLYRVDTMGQAKFGGTGEVQGFLHCLIILQYKLKSMSKIRADYINQGKQKMFN